MGHDKTYTLTYDRLALKELLRLDAFWQDEILAAVKGKLLGAPEVFGKPLRESLRGCRALRVGDYRAVFQIQQKTIRIIAIVHRSEKYKGMEKRI
jgi:mRNA interferase RelE/StbE